MSCAICEQRKEKRFCPAIHGRICPQCCGEQREVTLDCPSDCVYLQQARQHEGPRRLQDLDPAGLFLDVEIPQQFLYEQEHLLAGITFALAKSVRANRDINDADLLSVLTAMSRSYETLANSGLVYESPIPSIGQQGIVAEVQKMVKEYREAEQQHLGYTRLKHVDVLRTLVFLLRTGYTRTSGRPKSRAFADFLLSQFPEKPALVASPEDAGSRIITP